jgi:hypothetical protein
LEIEWKVEVYVGFSRILDYKNKNQSDLRIDERLANIRGFEFVVFIRSVAVFILPWPFLWMLGRNV